MEPSVTYRRWEEIIPVMAIRDDVVISRRGDLTVGWELSLPVACSLSEDDYDSLISRFYEAVRKLPPWTIVHRQDIYTYSTYEPDVSAGSFLSQSFERHFGGRRFLVHRSRIFLTLSNRASASRNGSSSGIFGIRFTADMPSEKDIRNFLASAEEFIQSAVDGDRVSARRLLSSDFEGEGDVPGIIQESAMLHGPSRMLSDFTEAPDWIEVVDRRAIAFSIGEAEQMPTEVCTTSEMESLSGSGGHLFLSFASRLGILLDCEHVVNQYILVEPQDAVAQRLERRRKRMTGDFGSSDNRVNGSQIGDYLDEVQRSGLFTVMSHVDVMAWDSPERMDEVRSKVSSALSSMSVTAAFNRFNTPILWYASIPGAEAELGYENYMTMELTSALCLGTWETFEPSLRGGAFRITDRLRNIPVDIDVQSAARDMQLIDNYNAFVLGGSGTGKSFFTNFYLRNCYDRGEHVFIIDVGDSYEGLCSVVHEESGGRDGFYHSWDVEHPFSFNPFIGWEEWLDSRNTLRQDCNGANFLLSFLQTSWEPEGGWTSEKVPVLRSMVTDFLLHCRDGGEDSLPVFDDMYRFFLESVAPAVESGQYMCNGIRISLSRLDVVSFCLALQPYSSQGAFSFLLNERHPADLFSSRFTVFEVDTLSQVNDAKFYSLCILCIINAFDQKMRRSPDFKLMVIEEAWKAIANETMAPYLAGLWKTARKFRTSAMVVTQQVSDILSSDVIRDTILQNSSVRMLLDQSNNRGCFSQIEELLGLSEMDSNLVFSVNRSVRPGLHYKEVFIKLGDKRSGVYAVEVSPEEAICYESDKVRKRPFHELASKIGYMEAARTLAEEKRRKI